MRFARIDRARTAGVRELGESEIERGIACAFMLAIVDKQSNALFREDGGRRWMRDDGRWKMTEGRGRAALGGGSEG